MTTNNSTPTPIATAAHTAPHNTTHTHTTNTHTHTHTQHILTLTHNTHTLTHNTHTHTHTHNKHTHTLTAVHQKLTTNNCTPTPIATAAHTAPHQQLISAVTFCICVRLSARLNLSWYSSPSLKCPWFFSVPPHKFRPTQCSNPQSLTALSPFTNHTVPHATKPNLKSCERRTGNFTPPRHTTRGLQLLVFI